MSGSLTDEAQSKLEGSKVLVVEDESMIAMLIEEMLMDLGCGSIWVASNMEEAQAILRDNRPHLAVLDVNLGGDSGYRLAGELAAADIPFVFATGYGKHGILPQWASRPVIQKPFKLDALAVALASLR
jgi:CheY-like chemotaxis protein